MNIFLNMYNNFIEFTYQIQEGIIITLGKYNKYSSIS